MLRPTRAIFVLLASLSLLAACDGGPEPGCEDMAQQVRGAMTLANRCTGCHSTSANDRNGAPAGVNFDSAADIDVHQDKMRNRAVVMRNMPPAPPLGQGPLTDAEVADVQAFLDCR
jgi:uncharacterized membrane protein